MTKSSTVETPSVEDTLSNFTLGTVPSLEPTEVEQRVAEAPEAEPVEPLSEEEAAKLYVEAAAIDEALARLTERKEAIKETYRRLDYGTQVVHAESGGKVTIGHTPVFNEARFLVAFPYDQMVEKDEVEVAQDGSKSIVTHETYPNRDLYKITPDRPAAKRILGADVYAEYMDEGTKKVTIK